nr:single-pass membrane and coiled-coil domain-containing protein 3-like [Misgurnus anguillicaudatus]
MSWSEVFYPGNSERREQLIRKSQQFTDLMEGNFDATNDLIEVLNKYLGFSFSPVTLNEKGTLKQNCDVLIQHIHEIQAQIQTFDKELKEKLDPVAYEKLKKMDLILPEQAKIVEDTVGVGGSVVVVVVGWLLKSRFVLESVVSQIRYIGSTTIGSVVLGVVFLGIDMIAGAIMGSIERDQLEKALKEYDSALDEFKPASKKYQYRVTEFKARIHMMGEK